MRWPSISIPRLFAWARYPIGQIQYSEDQGHGTYPRGVGPYWQRVRYVSISDNSRGFLALKRTDHSAKNFQLITQKQGIFKLAVQYSRNDPRTNNRYCLSYQAHRDGSSLNYIIDTDLIETPHYRYGNGIPIDVGTIYYWCPRTNNVSLVRSELE